MKTITCMVLFLGGIFNAYGQDYYSSFIKYFQQGDTAVMADILHGWQRSFPNNAELYVSWIDYYYLKSHMEKDQSVKGKYFAKGIATADSAISHFPDRLDIRFGKIYALGLKKNWRLFTDEILAAVRYSAVNNNKWTWIENKRKVNGKDFFLNSLQQYQSQLFNTGDIALTENIGDIARAILKLYPDHEESLSNLGMTFIMSGKPELAVDLLLKAENLKPADFTVLSNLAYAYKLLGNKDKAIEYYNKTIQYGDEDAKKYASEEVERLKDGLPRPPKADSQ